MMSFNLYYKELQLKCLFLLNKLIKENALPSILVLASTAVRSTATLAKTQKHRNNLERFTPFDTYRF